MTHLSRILLWLGLGLLAVQVPLLFVAAQKSAHTINPDAVAYLRIAQYYSEGRFDLAVSGYWGPLFSWLSMPFLNISENPVVTARIVTAFSAVLFLLGSLSAVVGLGLKWPQIILVGCLVALFSVYWSVAVIAPDLLMSGLLLNGFGLSVSAVKTTSRRRLFLSGLSYGLAYLAKAVALPVSLGLILGLTLLRLYVGVIDQITAVRVLRWTGSGLAILASPWIIVLSLHYGKPTFSTSGPIAHAIVGPNSEGHFIDYMYQSPEPGRITTWEEPSRLPYRHWSPFESRAALLHQFNLIKWNLERVEFNLAGFISGKLAAFASTKLGEAAILIAAFVLFFWPGWRERLKANPWRLSIPAIAILCGVYLPVFASDQRYYLACYPLLLATAFGLSENLAKKLPYQVAPKAALPVLVFVVLLWRIWPNFATTLTQGKSVPSYIAAEKIAPLFRGQSFHGIASVQKMSLGLYTAFLANIPYYGNRLDAHNTNDVLDSGAELLFVDGTSELNETLMHHPRFVQINEALRKQIDWSADWSVNVYKVLPDTDQVERNTK